MRMVQTAILGMDGTIRSFGHLQAQGRDRTPDILHQERRESQTAEGVEQIVGERVPAAGSYSSAAGIDGQI